MIQLSQRYLEKSLYVLLSLMVFTVGVYINYGQYNRYQSLKVKLKDQQKSLSLVRSVQKNVNLIQKTNSRLSERHQSHLGNLPEISKKSKVLQSLKSILQEQKIPLLALDPSVPEQLKTLKTSNNATLFSWTINMTVKSTFSHLLYLLNEVESHRFPMNISSVSLRNQPTTQTIESRLTIKTHLIDKP